MSDNKLMIIDGHSLAFRAFYGTPVDRFMTANGQHTNAIYGFISMLLRMLEDHKPSSLAITFDVSRHSFRTEEYPEYKGTRGATPPEFKGQVPLLQETLQAMGITVLQKAGFEADDLIATLTSRAVAAGDKVLVVSGDRDTIQLVTDDVTLLYPASQGVREMKAYDPAAVYEKYGVAPEQYRIIAALVGETSDNLPGIPKVGPKTATKWVQQYGTFAEIMAHQDDIKGVVGQNLRDNAHLAERNYRLNKLLQDVDIDVDLAALRLAQPNMEEMLAAFERLEFRTLKARVIKFFAADQGVAAGAGSEAGASSTAGAGNAVAAAGGEAVVANTVTGVSQIAAAAGGTGEIQARYLRPTEVMPWVESVANPAVVLVQHLDDTAEILVYLASESETVAFSWKLGSQDFLKFKNWLASAKPKQLWSQAGMVHDEIKIGGVSVDFKLLAQLKRPDLDNSTFLKAIANVTDIKPAPFAGAERANALRLGAQQVLEQLTDAERKLYTETEMPLAPVLAQMHQRGVAIDTAVLEQQAAQLGAEIVVLEQRAAELIGREVSLTSTQQLQTVLFEDLQMPKTRKIKSGYSTDAAAIEELQMQAPHEFLDVLATHREQNKLKQIIQTLLDEVQEDGRIHTRLLQLGAVTGRLSSDRPNLQNIPIRTTAGAEIRRAFTHGPEYEGIFTADYSQIEMRVMAHLSGDDELIEAFNDGEDLHRSVGARVFGVAPAEVTSEMRSRVKAMSYGLAYGLGAFGLAKQLGISQAEAKQLMGDYFVRFGAIRDYLRDVVENARELGYTETMFGRRRPFPGLKSPNRILQKNAERAAQNAPIQGTAADIIKRAMVAIEARMKKEKLRSRMILQIHDELMFECAAGERMALELLVREEMANAAQLRVPLEVSVGFGANWQEAGH
ncbi:DNA polymerase-1 [Canibacter oris]|uniref:DNA polymerase I n=2 Tax=Canibacter oris TaxID=1365628 RepID=A0A840DDS2_9MICO|nr:DNA polymerase-1 [Canibacter oris]